MLGSVRSVIARARGWVAARAAGAKRRDAVGARRASAARPLRRTATSLVAGLAMVLAAPSAALAMSAGCAALNGMSGTYTINASGAGTDNWAAGAANGEVVTYSWSGNTKGAYVYVMFSQNNGNSYAGLTDQGTAVSGSGSFTTSGTGDVNDFYEVGVQNYSPNDADSADPSKNNSTVTINVSCSAPAPAPVLSSISPNSGPPAGGQTVTLTGQHFTGAVAVNSYGPDWSGFTVVSDTQITAVVPAGTEGASIPVVVWSPDGSSNELTYTYATPVPVASSYTYGSVTFYNPGDLSEPLSFNLAWAATNNPTSFAVASSTTAQGGTVSVDASGQVAYWPPVGFRGADSFQWRAINAGGQSNLATTTVVVGDPVYFMGAALPGGAVGAAYSSQASIAGGMAPYTNFSATGLPPGLSISSSGLITGTPTTAGNYTATLSFKDSSTGTGPFSGTAQAALTIASGADLQASWPGGGSSVTAGQTTALSAQVTNAGTGPAASVTAQFVLPAQITYSAITTPAGWSCITPAVGTTGTVNCTKTSIGAGALEMFTLTVGAGAAASPATTSVALNVTSATETESASKSLTILAPDMQASLTGPASVYRGQTATLTLTMTNAGTAVTPHASWSTTLPAGLTFTSLSTPAGWSCITPVAGGTGMVSCGQPSGIAAGAGQVFTLVATVGAGAASTTTVNVSALTSFESEFPSASFTVLEATPSVSAIMAPRGPSAGGTNVVLQGDNLSTATAVTWGGSSIPFTVISNNQIQVTTPAGTVGTAVPVTVTTPAGTSTPVQFAYVDTPTVVGLTPSSGPAAGGTNVVIHGTNLASASDVTLGGASVPFTVLSDNQIQITTPPGTGTADITVTVPFVGTSAPGAAARFTYAGVPTVSSVSPGVGPQTGGTTVIISGTNLSGALAVKFGATAATGFTVDSDTQITATAPAGSGLVDVRVTTVGGTSAVSAADNYIYAPAPAISAITPNSGPGGGGTTVVIGGVNFTGATAVTFGGVAATSFTVDWSGQITAVAPAGAAGTVDVRVTTPGGTSPTSAADQYTYVIPSVSLPASVANGTVGVAYSQSVAAANAASYVQTAGVLPPGVTLDGVTGALTGTPTAGGTFNFEITATGQPGYTPGVRFYAVTIAPPTVLVGPADLAPATATVPYSQTLIAAGGTPGYTWAVTSGTLPAGLTLSEGGVLSGTPTQPGTYIFTATATDSSTGTQYAGSQAFTLVVSAPTVMVSPPSLPNAPAGASYSQTLSASGAAEPYTFTVTAGALPTGLNLTQDGVLSGMPTEAGAFNFTVTATDSSAGGGFAGSRAYTLVVGAPNLDLQPASLPHGQQGAAFSQTLVASGGVAPYSFSFTGTLPSGVTLGADGVLSGTPTQSGTFNFAVVARDSTTGPGAPYGVVRGYAWIVDVAAPPVASATSVDVPYASAGTAIDLTAKVSGVADSIAIGTAPAHGTVSISGFVVTYTPAAGYYGDDSFTYTAAGPGGTSNAATVSLTVANPPAPVVANASAAVGFNSAGQAIDLSASITGVYGSVAVVSGPAHGTTSVAGAVVTYTPAGGYFGTDSFTYTATGPGGTSAPATVSLTVATPPPPNPVPPTGPAQVNAGGDVGVTITNVGGLATGVQITTPPSHGTVSVGSLVTPAAAPSAAVPGFVLTYTPNPGYSGPDSFAYALVGPGGTSQPQTVQVTVLATVALEPIEVSTLQGVPVQVDVTAGATGGPFTGAAVVSVGPNSAGTASFAQVGGSRVMTFTPADDFTGVAVVTYTVSNADSTSAPSTVTVTVEARPNPALDADVRGLISAQVQAAQRFVDTQVQNFSQRNEQLHGQGDQEGPRKHALGLTFGFGDYAGGRPEDPASEIRRREMPERPFADQARRLDELALAAADADAAPGGLGPIGGGRVALWSAGSIDFGQRHADAGGSKLKFTTSGVSLGADVEVADGLFLGVGAGYGYDATDIGSEGTRNASRSYMGAVYGSWRIAPQLYLDGVAGLGELSFDSRRIAANDATVIGRRDGSQAFGSLSLAFDHQDGPMTVSSYGRLTVSKAKLDAFTETGDPVFALAYDAQDVDASFGTLGVRGQWNHALEDGSFTPRVRAEWRRQLSGADAALVRYADFLTGPSYQVDPLAQSQNTLLLGVGGDWRWDEGLSLSLDYEGQLGDEALSHRVTLKVSTRF